MKAITLLVTFAIQLSVSNIRAATLQMLPELPDGYRSFPNALSADGTTVIGVANRMDFPSPTSLAFRWSRDTGIENLGNLPGGQGNSSAADVSADGSVVVGSSGPDLGRLGFRWTRATGMQPVGEAEVGKSEFGLAAVSDDGLTISGTHIEGNATAFYSRDGLPLQPIGLFEVDAMSGNGRVVLGRTISAPYDVISWTQETGPVGLGILGNPTGVSFDGSIVVGNLFGIIPQAFRWTADIGFVSLEPFSQVEGLSGDGSLAVGQLDNQAVVWDSLGHRTSVRELLTNQGLDVTSWHFNDALDVSYNGRTIIGFGDDLEAGIGGIWIARIPEPPSIFLLSWALIALSFCRQRSFSRAK
jgi:uncharacterized membrane protein